MNTRLVIGCLALLVAACAKRDPFDDPEYAAACHGPPLETAQAREEAQSKGYPINARFDCIDRQTWEAEEKAKAGPIALYASRFNTMFSIGMLYCMAAQSHGGFV